MQVTNPNPTQEFHANVFGEWYSIDAGASIDVTDPAVVATLAEYGAGVDAVELEAARAAQAATNREINSASASASASEGSILARQQATVDPVTGGVDGGELKGAALDAAVRQANDEGANIKASASAGDKRTALAAHRATTGTSTSPTNLDEFLVGPDGELAIDSTTGQPIPATTDAYLRDDDGNVLFDDDGSPKAIPQDEGDADNPDEGSGHSDVGDGNA